MGTLTALLQTLPGVLGGPLRRVLHAAPALSKAAALEARIDCVGPKPGGAKIKTIRNWWHYEERVSRTRFELGSETLVAIAFCLPYDLPESDPDRTGDDATWLLSVRATLSGADYEACFDLPVFQTTESSPMEEGSRVAALTLVSPPRSGAVPALPGSKISVRRLATSGRELVFGLLRNPRHGLLGVFATLFFGASVALLRYAGTASFLSLAFGLVTVILAVVSFTHSLGSPVSKSNRGGLATPFGESQLPPNILGVSGFCRVSSSPQNGVSDRYC